MVFKIPLNLCEVKGHPLPDKKFLCFPENASEVFSSVTQKPKTELGSNRTYGYLKYLIYVLLSHFSHLLNLLEGRINSQVFKDRTMSYKIYSFISGAIYICLREEQLSLSSLTKCAKLWFCAHWFHLMRG